MNPIVTKPTKLLSNWILIMSGIHVFCGPQLYTAPYGAKEGGWFGLSLLFLYCGFTWGSCHYIGLLTNDNRLIRTYTDIGKYAYGKGGAYFVMVIVCLLSYASSVESSTISKDVLALVYPGHVTLLGGKIEHHKLFSSLMCLVMLIIVYFVPDLDLCDPWLTGGGVVMNIVVVCCLCWLGLFNTVKNTSATKFVRFSNWTIASGFFAYCFSAHPWLPQLCNSLKNRNIYGEIINTIYLPSLALYFIAACAGYAKFGEKVDAIFILSMPMEFYASQIAAHVTVAHQLIRYIFGIYGVVQSAEEVCKADFPSFFTPSRCAALRSALVVLTIPLTIMIKYYGPMMALLGSILGIVVALIIPCAFVTKLRKQQMNRFEIAGSYFVVILACVALIAGATGSIKDMINDK